MSKHRSVRDNVQYQGIEIQEGHEYEAKDDFELSQNVYMFPNRPIGCRVNVFEGEVRSSVYDVRDCVIKFSAISEQNVREVEILTKLGSHTNVIAIIQSGTYHDVFGDRVYIALDKCHNENLRQFLANRKAVEIEYDLNQAIDFAKQIIAGVMYIHDNNVIHLDLKPSNILISQNLRLIKIADFGLSIVVKSPKSKVFHKRQFGTNGYRPIESFGNGIVSQRTDIFSLGTVLLHLLSNGNDVFGCDDHIFVNNVMTDVTNVSGLLVSNPDTTEHLIKCMVRKERCRRPTIWEVSDHPCWSGRQLICNIDYIADDEVDDDAPEDEIVDGETRASAVSQTQTNNLFMEREFLRKMREMGFDRKPSVVVFDRVSERIFRFDHRKQSLTKIREFPPTVRYSFNATAFDEYIYIFDTRGSVYRIEYCDMVSKWERMNDWTKFRGFAAPTVSASSNAIFLADSGRKASKSIVKYSPSSDQYERVYGKPTATYSSTLVCTKEFLYCIGGHQSSGISTNIVERIDLVTLEWTIVANAKHGKFDCATECRGNIYCARQTQFKVGSEMTIEMYNPKVDQWAVLSSLKMNHSAYLRGAFTIDGNILVVSLRDIFKYDVEQDEWSIATTFETIRTHAAAVVAMTT